MRKNLFVGVLIYLGGMPAVWANTEEISQILSQTRELMESQNYSEAQGIILSGLRKNRSSYKLWLALGNAFEAGEQYEEALKALYHARELQPDIEGVRSRIAHIQEVVETKRERLIGDELPLLEQARKKISKNHIRSGLELFAEAVFKDRSLLGTESEIISLGADFFADESSVVKDADRKFYQGIYDFFSGNHDYAATHLEQFIENYPENVNIDRAKDTLEEIKGFQKQLQKYVAQDRFDASSAVIESKTEKELEIQANIPEIANTKPLDSLAQVSVTDEYAGMSNEELYSEALDLAVRRPIKAIELLSRITSTDNAQPEHFMALGDICSSTSEFESEALSAYRDLIKNFPGSELVSEARQKILQLNPSAEERSRQVHEYFSTNP